MSGIYRVDIIPCPDGCYFYSEKIDHIHDGDKVWGPEGINEIVARKLGRLGEPPDSLHWSWDGAVLPRTINPIPDYCGSIAAAWEIFEGCGFEAIRKLPLGKWIVGYSYSTVEQSPEADTVPMAICLAFLKLEDQR